jgi:hypothetical protein
MGGSSALRTPTAGPPAGIERKAVPVGGGVVSTDDATGVVEAIVSVTGVVDEHGDIIVPGAYADTLTRRRPKGIWSHGWSDWVARTEDIAELLPGDRRLPASTRDGSPWPAEAGALWVKHRYNLATKAGADAYANVDFFREDCEYSIDYVVPPGKAQRPARGGDPRVKRLIYGLDLFAYSPVLFGAAPLTSTLSMKGLVGDGPAGDPERIETDDPDGDDGAALHADARDQVDWAEVDDAAGAAPPDAPDDDLEKPAGAGQDDLNGGEQDPGGDEAGAEAKAAGGKCRYCKAKATKAVMWGDGGQIKTCDGHVGMARNSVKRQGGKVGEVRSLAEKKAGTPGVADTPSDHASVARLVNWYEHGEGAAQIRWTQPGDFMRCVRIAGKHMDPQRARGFCALRHRGATGVWPGREGGGKKGLLIEWDPAAEVGPDAAGQPAAAGLEQKRNGMPPKLPGSYEERSDALRAALEELFREPEPEPDTDGSAPVPSRVWVQVVATYDDRAVCYVEYPGPVEHGEAYDVPYSIDEQTGEAVLGEPRSVSLTLTAEPDGDGGEAAAPGDALPIADKVDQAAMMAKLLTFAPEAKSGRVLSTANADRLRRAVESLLAVLAAAGVPIDRDHKQPNEEPPPAAIVHRDSTAPSAAADTAPMQGKTVHVQIEPGQVLLDPALYARALRLRGERRP